MQLRRCTWTVLLVVILHISSTIPIPFRSDEYYYLDPDMDDDMDYLQTADFADADYRPNESDADYVMLPRSAETTTECETEAPTTHSPHGSGATTCIAILPGAKPMPPGYPVQPPPPPGQPAPPTQPPQPPAPQPYPPPPPPPPPPQQPPPPPQQTQVPPPPHPSPPQSPPATSKPSPAEPPATTKPGKTTTPKSEEETTTCVDDEPTTATSKPTTLPYPYLRPVEATTCIAVKSGGGGGNASLENLYFPASVAYPSFTEQEGKTRALHSLVQHLYVAQARVQLEAIEIKKAQAVANSAQQQLEEAANHVRSVTAALQNAQQEVASAAIRAQTAQLQLAAHDQLLFAARQDVDALSSQMVGLQAAEGIAVPTVKFDIGSLLDKLKQPLPAAELPTAVPPVISAQEVAPPDPATLYVDYDYD